MRAGGDDGFSLIEVVIAGAIVALAALVALTACKVVAGLTTAAYTTGHDAVVLDEQAGRLRDDATSALAVFIPAADMNGAANGDATAHELDFLVRGSDGVDGLRRYFYDAEAHTLQRFDADPGGATGVRDSTTGKIVTAAAYPPLRDVAAFRLARIAANELGDSSRNAYGAVGALFARPARAYSIGVARAGVEPAEARGGNAIVQVTLATNHATRIVHLIAGAMPSGFTVTGLPRWHAIVYRVDQTHRSLFGFAGKSHVFINARIDVSYDGWQSRSAWCDYNLLGNPDGLDGHDPHADYTPDQPFEQAEALLARCRALHPTPPPRGSVGNPPEPGVVTPLLPGPTPPPCWSAPGPAGRCWPADAPPDWTPPAPLPADTPPPQWCATHAQSIACAARIHLSEPGPAQPTAR